MTSCDFVAGCIGGSAGVAVGHPLDTLKAGTLQYMHCTLYNVYCSTCTVHYTLFTLYNVYCRTWTVHYTLFTLYNVYCTM